MFVYYDCDVWRCVALLMVMRVCVCGGQRTDHGRHGVGVVGRGSCAHGCRVQRTGVLLERLCSCEWRCFLLSTLSSFEVYVGLSRIVWLVVAVPDGWQTGSNSSTHLVLKHNIRWDSPVPIHSQQSPASDNYSKPRVFWACLLVASCGIHVCTSKCRQLWIPRRVITQNYNLLACAAQRITYLKPFSY